MKRIWFFLASALLMLSAAGSRDTIASLDRAMVHAVGIDREDEGYTVTLQVFRPDSSGTETQLDAGKANVFVITASAPTVGEAMTLCENRLGEFLFIGHGQVIVLGEGVEPDDPRRLFAYFLSSKESYLGIHLACTEGKASELLSAELSEGAVAAQNLVNIIERHAENSSSVSCTLLDVLGCGECPAVLPLLRLTKTSDSSEGQDSESGSEPALTVSADGAEAFFRGGKQHLTPEECSVLALFDGQERVNVLRVPTGRGDSAVTVRNGGLRKSVTKEGDRILFSFEPETAVRNDQSLETLFDLAELEEYCRRELQGRCEAFISRFYGDEKTDLLGLCTMVKSRYPQVWLDCGGDAERVLGLCEAGISVKCEIK